MYGLPCTCSREPSAPQTKSRNSLCHLVGSRYGHRHDLGSNRPGRRGSCLPTEFYRRSRFFRVG